MGTFTDLAFHKEIDQLASLDATVWNPSTGEKALLVQGSDVRATQDGVEKWYGMIRAVRDDPYTNSKDIHALGKVVRAQDRMWNTRRTKTTIAADAIVYEVLASSDGDPTVGQVFYSDLESVASGGGLQDLSGNAAVGTIGGSPVVETGRFGACYRFPANGDKVTYPQISAYDFTGAFSVSWWMNIPSFAVAWRTIAVKAVANRGWEVGIGGGFGKDVFLSSADGTAAQVNFTTGGSGFGDLGTNVWNHFVVTWDGTAGHTPKLYRNGTLLGSFNWSVNGSRGISSATASLLAPGSCTSILDPTDPSSGVNYNVRIDEVYVYNRALTQADVNVLAGQATLEGGLLADRFDPALVDYVPTDRLSLVDLVAKVTAGEWWADRDGSDKDRFRFTKNRSYQPGIPLDYALYYDMEHLIGGLMQDFSANNNDGTVVGTTDLAARFGRGRGFNGTSDKITAADSTSLRPAGAVTVAAWIRVPSTINNNKYHPICIKSGGEHQGWKLAWDNRTAANNLWWEIGDGTTNFITLINAVNWAANDIHHVAGVFDGGLSTQKLKVYIDGMLFANSGSSYGTVTAIASDAGAAEVGSWVSSAFFSAFQYVDEVYVYARALSATEITALANPPITLQLNVNVSDLEQKLDRDVVRNDVVFLGAGDGTLQLQARTFHATTVRTFLTALYASGSTASIPVVDSSAFPTQGVVYLGQERVFYNGKDATHLGTTSVTRAYTADGTSSYAAYDHQAGLEVYLHGDTSVTPAVYYTQAAPQTGSSIQVNGWRQEQVTDRGLRKQDSLDRAAQRILAAFKDPRESVTASVPGHTVPLDVGDSAVVLNADGSAYQNSPYRIVVVDFDWEGVALSVELANPRDVRDAELAQLSESVGRDTSATQGFVNTDPTTGTAKATSVSSQSKSGAPTTTDIPAGSFMVWKDTGTGNVYLYINDGGTLKKVQLT